MAQRPLPLGRVQQRLHVQRLAGAPRGERRRRQQAVQLHRQRRAVGGWEELVELEHAELADRRLLDHADERRQVERGARRPRVLDQVGEQDVLAARQRVGVDADEAEQPRGVALDLVADHLEVVRRRCLQRPDDVDRHARLRPGRVDREVRRPAQRRDLLGPVAPAGQAVAPGRGLLLGELVGRHAGRLGLGLVDPRPERRRREVRERQAQVGQITLRVDQQGRQPGRQHLLDEHHAEARLAGAGHADDDAVGREVLGLEADVGRRCARGWRRRRARRGTAQPWARNVLTALITVVVWRSAASPPRPWTSTPASKRTTPGRSGRPTRRRSSRP